MYVQRITKKTLEMQSWIYEVKSTWKIERREEFKLSNQFGLVNRGGSLRLCKV